MRGQGLPGGPCYTWSVTYRIGENVLVALCLSKAMIAHQCGMGNFCIGGENDRRCTESSLWIGKHKINRRRKQTLIQLMRSTLTHRMAKAWSLPNKHSLPCTWRCLRVRVTVTHGHPVWVIKIVIDINHNRTHHFSLHCCLPQLLPIWLLTSVQNKPLSWLPICETVSFSNFSSSWDQVPSHTIRRINNID